MNLLPPFCLMCLTLALAGVSSVRAAAGTNAPAQNDATATATNAPVPQSVFEVPKTPVEGRDPFFPNSSRAYGTLATAATNATPAVVQLSLKALAGTAERRFATVNNRVFEVGEEGEVTTPTGRVRVRCLEIRSDSVLIEVGGVQRQLRMRPGF